MLKNLKREGTVLFAATALLTAGCAMMAPKAERYVAPPVGTTWERSQTDTGSYGSGNARLTSRRGEGTWQGQSIITFEGAAGGLAVYAQPNGAWLGLFKSGAPVVTFDPPQSYQFPLEVGKTWSREQRMTLFPARRTVSYSLTQKVETYEDVTVPGGTFKAFKISTVNTLGEEGLTWFSPELGIFIKQSLKRTAKHAQGPGTREVELLSYKRAGQ